MTKMRMKMMGMALTVSAVTAALSIPALCTKKAGFKIAFGSVLAAECAAGLFLLTQKPKARIKFLTDSDAGLFTDEEIADIKAALRDDEGEDEN